MRHLLAILVVLLCSTQLYSQEYKDLRTIGYVEIEGNYNDTTQKYDEEYSSGITISFMILNNKPAGVKYCRLYVDAGYGETTNDYLISRETSPTSDKPYRTYILSPPFGKTHMFTYDNENFIIYYDGVVKDGKHKYIKYYQGVILTK